MVQIQNSFLVFVGAPKVAHGRDVTTEIHIGEIVEGMTLFRLNQVMRDHCVEQPAFDVDAFPSQSSQNRLDVMADLGDFRVFNEGFLFFPLVLVLG